MMNGAENVAVVSGMGNRTFDTGTNKTGKLVWGAIIAGAVVSLASATLLNFLGLGLGLSALNLKGNSVVLLPFGIGAAVWLFVSGIVSSWICGWLAGIFSCTACKFARACHGLVSWCMALLMTILLVAVGAGTAIGGAAGMIEHSPKQVKAKMTEGISKNLAEYTTNPESSNVGMGTDTSATNDDAINTVGVSSLLIFALLFISALASILGAAFCRSTTDREQMQT